MRFLHIIFCLLVSFTFLSAQNLKAEYKSAFKSPNPSVQFINNKLKEARNLIHLNDEKALQIALLALDKAERIGNKNLTGKTENLIGDLYWYSNDYSTASEFYFRALKNFQGTNNRSSIAECYRNIGWIYLGEKNFKMAERYFIRSSRIFKNLNSEHKYMVSLDDLANLYLTEGKYEKALKSSQFSISIAEKSKDLKAIGSTACTIGTIYYRLNKISEAEYYFNYSISTLSSFKNQGYNRCISLIGLSRIKFDNQQYEAALNKSILAEKEAQKGNFNKELSEIFQLIAQVYKKLNKTEKAYEYMERYSRAKDSLLEQNNRDIIKDLENRNKIKEDKLKIQNLVQKGNLDKVKLERERTFKTFLILILILIFVFAIFLIRSFIKKKKANESLSNAYKIIEEKNKDISDSIDYAKHIQQARLPLLENLKNSFKDIFVYNLPRDTVSGDFYWFDKRPDGSIYFVCADCTGHGIPGAFMSMMGIDGFNHAILERNIEKSGDILTHVNQFIKDSLNQEHESAKSKDGMDVALIYINPEKTKLSYSGANRPIYIVRGEKLIELKPNKLSIGGNHLSNYSFSEEVVDLQTGDSVYLFTDGYPDQFGGENGKKFMAKKLKDLFIEHHSKPMFEQAQLIEKSFNNWMGENAQIDDVLVVGIQI